MLVLRFERLFAGKSAQTLRAQSVCRRMPIAGCPYKRNSAKIPKRSPAVQAAGRKRGDGRKRKPVKNAVRTCEKRVRSKRIKIIAKKC